MVRAKLPLKPCLYCNNLFKPKWHKIKYCSRICFHADGKNRTKGNKINCLTCNKQRYVPNHLVSGKKKAIFCSQSCATKHTHKDQFFKVGHNSPQARGSLSHAWRGGKTSEAKIIRSSTEYAKWRNEVFKRDNWTCQECGIRGKKLHSHHKKSFARYPELRLEVSNGITLCHDCHKKTPNYGRNNYVA